MTAENKEYIKEVGEIDEYILTLDNRYFNEKIHISNDIKIISIRIKKNINKVNDDSDNDSLMTDTDDKIRIVSIEKNNHCGYILYGTSDMH